MINKESPEIKNHQVVSHEEWLAARIALLAKEKEFTRQREELARLRRALPWEKGEKQYVFDGLGGKETVPDLFGKHSQLVVYHFMFGPDDDEGCLHCSFWADSLNGASMHLPHPVVSFAATPRAPLARLPPFNPRMGVLCTWFSWPPCDFNFL